MHCPMLQSFSTIMVKRSCILPVSTEANTINTAKQRREYISLFTQFLLSKKSVSVKPKAIWNIFKFFTSFQIAKGNKYFRQTPINLTSHSKIKVCSGSTYTSLSNKRNWLHFFTVSNSVANFTNLEMKLPKLVPNIDFLKWSKLATLLFYIYKTSSTCCASTTSC